MSEKEKLYEEVKLRILYLLENKILSQIQCDFMLTKIRKDLGLFALK